jgi:hypothetical protein
MKQTVSTTVRKIEIQRFGVTSSKPFQAVLASLQSAIGQPSMSEFGKDVASAAAYKDLEQVVGKAVGSSGLMEFMRLDLGRGPAERAWTTSAQGSAADRGQPAHHEADA